MYIQYDTLSIMSLFQDVLQVLSKLTVVAEWKKKPIAQFDAVIVSLGKETWLSLEKDSKIYH